MLRRGLIALVRIYQVGMSAWTPASCRFTPTCSAYAIEALQLHGVVRGGWLAIRRLFRCHPWGGKGFDPVALPTPNATTLPGTAPADQPGANRG